MEVRVLFSLSICYLWSGKRCEVSMEVRALSSLSICYLWSGERCEVSMEVRVDDRTASKLNTCQEKLYDILVLHLDKGKDIFITVQGKLLSIHSCLERACAGLDRQLLTM